MCKKDGDSFQIIPEPNLYLIIPLKTERKVITKGLKKSSNHKGKNSGFLCIFSNENDQEKYKVDPQLPVQLEKEIYRWTNSMRAWNNVGWMIYM